MDNSATNQGGALHTEASAGTITISTNTVFANNSTTSGAGVAIQTSSRVNVTITGNAENKNVFNSWNAAYPENGDDTGLAEGKGQHVYRCANSGATLTWSNCLSVGMDSLLLAITDGVVSGESAVEYN